ncbi:MAG TPA: YkgJ family cysteine cluster protein [Nitrospira sp.]|nr:YkgJ family cysteine cluster protein [Nitrospira sp.]
MQPPMPFPLTTLAGKTDDWFRRANAALLTQVPCHAGCSCCCIGLFSITRLDARRVQEGFTRLPAVARERIAARATQQVRALETAYPRLKTSTSIDDWSDKDIDQTVSLFHDIPCPALQDNGLCALYAYRPLTCRSMGIPTQQDAMVYGACEVQTFVPIVRLSTSLAAEEHTLAKEEAVELAALPEVAEQGEEIFLPYAFIADRRDSDGSQRPTHHSTS